METWIRVTRLSCAIEAPMSGPETLHVVARRLRAASRVLALTGAGISAESGVPTFRGPDGLWKNFRATDLATPGAFARDPALVWEWYRWRRSRIRDAAPNPGHLVLARFERRWPAFTLATQNVDGLHHQAGSLRLLELHGNIWRARCSARCGHVVTAAPDEDARFGAPADRAVPVCACGALMRPDIVWFGESLDEAILGRALEEAEAADALLVIGTSSVVYPAAALPGLAHRHGALVVEINVEETPLTSAADYAVRGLAGEVLPALEALL
jgi:NAD-dependent deacetylase